MGGGTDKYLYDDTEFEGEVARKHFTGKTDIEAETEALLWLAGKGEK